MEVREHRDDLVNRLPMLRFGFVVAVAAIASTYWFVQVVHGSFYRERAEHNRLRNTPVKAPRGLIYDRHDRLLADNVPSYQLYLDRSRSDDVEESLRHAAETLGRPVEELREELDLYRGASRFTPVQLADNLLLSDVARFSVEALEHPEFEIEVGQLRVYRHGSIASHLLGYLGEATEEDLAAGGSELRLGDRVGRSGVELAFDDLLRGSDGERVAVVDSRGMRREEYGSEEASAGADLRLTLDLDLQQVASRYFEDRVGAAVVLDARSGEILALVSSPSFEPNLFSRQMADREWARILEAPNHPLQNRALSSAYSPGSIFKIVVATAGLNEGLVNQTERVYCSGATRIYNQRFRCWKRGGHGWVNLRDSIKESCDIFFYQLGQKLGIERIARYARLMGLGERTGLELAGEEDGLVPNGAWSRRRRGTPWYPGETISVSIGQGPLLVTPLQMATLMATVANGGRRVTPHLTASAEPAPSQSIKLDPRVLEPIREALWAVVNEKGTGAVSRLAGLDIAGKTGTVQVVRQKTWIDSKDLPFEKRDHAWFASFGTFEDPELVVVVFVEHGGKGSEEAAPLAKLLYEKYYGNRAASGRAS